MSRVLFLSMVLAQAPDFSGTWKLDESQSRISAEAAYAGLIGVGAPATLHVSHARNGTLVIESQINESHSRLYLPGQTTTTPVYLGAPGSVAMTSRWDGGKLVSEGQRKSETGAQEIEESIGLAEDGRTLEIEISVRGPEGESSSSLRYIRIQSVGACDTWPTPCK